MKSAPLCPRHLLGLFVLVAAFSVARAGATFVPVETLISPQVVAGSEFVTTLVLSNSMLGSACDVRVTYEQGGGTQPSATILTNGEDLGNSFIRTLPGVSEAQSSGATFSELEITTLDGVFVGAAVVEVRRRCESLVGVQTSYLLDGPSGFENFGYSDGNVAILRSLGDCASFPWSYREGLEDLGIALISRRSPATQIVYEALASDGATVIDNLSLPADYDGSHTSRLISEILDPSLLSSAGSGLFRVCARTTAPQSPTAVLALGVLQRPSPAPAAGSGGVQFALVQPRVDRDGCRDERFQVCLGRRYVVTLKNDGRPLGVLDILTQRSRARLRLRAAEDHVETARATFSSLLNGSVVSVAALDRGRLSVSIDLEFPIDVDVCIQDLDTGQAIQVSRTDLVRDEGGGVDLGVIVAGGSF